MCMLSIAVLDFVENSSFRGIASIKVFPYFLSRTSTIRKSRGTTRHGREQRGTSRESLEKVGKSESRRGGCSFCCRDSPTGAPHTGGSPYMGRGRTSTGASVWPDQDRPGTRRREAAADSRSRGTLQGGGTSANETPLLGAY